MTESDLPDSPMPDETTNAGPDTRPVLGITMGDPAGIGPEIIVKALAQPDVRQLARFVVYGTNQSLLQAAEGAGIEPFWWRTSAAADGVDEDLNQEVVVIDHDQYADFATGIAPGPARSGMTPAAPSRVGGEASLAYINRAIDAALIERVDPGHVESVVTAPISKQSWHLAGLKRFAGHTELFADRTRAKRHAMMFVAPHLRVVLATVHLPLMDIRNVLTIGRVFDPIDLGHQACRDLLGIPQPRIAVCGLNPHASDGGLFGDEEYRLIEPAIKLANEAGIDAKGPYPGDTVFNAAVEGKFDLVVAMYHDQGTIPIKLLARDGGVNVTLGLPIIRTSPDHGTAFDIAGRNRANPGSMAASIRLAAQMALVRRRRERPQPA